MEESGSVACVSTPSCRLRARSSPSEQHRRSPGLWGGPRNAPQGTSDPAPRSLRCPRCSQMKRGRREGREQPRASPPRLCSSSAEAQDASTRQCGGALCWCPLTATQASESPKKTVPTPLTHCSLPGQFFLTICRSGRSAPAYFARALRFIVRVENPRFCGLLLSASRSALQDSRSKFRSGFVRISAPVRAGRRVRAQHPLPAAESGRASSLHNPNSRVLTHNSRNGRPEEAKGASPARARVHLAAHSRLDSSNGHGAAIWRLSCRMGPVSVAHYRFRQHV